MTEIEGRVVPAPRQPEQAQPEPAQPEPAQPEPAEVGPRPLRYEHIALVDLLDRLLAGGVVITGEVRLAIADVDLVNVSLRALISSVSTVLEHGGPVREEGT
jgi:Gas vesicle protein